MGTSCWQRSLRPQVGIPHFQVCLNAVYSLLAQTANESQLYTETCVGSSWESGRIGSVSSIR